MYRLAVVELGAVLFVSGCAKAPGSIAPSYVSTVPYESYNCQHLGQERARLEQAFAIVPNAQEEARSVDTMGVFFLGVPTSTRFGGIAPLIANLKGQMVAVDQIMIAKNC